MARLARAEVFDPSEVAVLHLCARVVVVAFSLASIRLEPTDSASSCPHWGAIGFRLLVAGK